MARKSKKFKLSKQAMTAFMAALQKCLAEETDIVPILAGLELENTDDGLVVLNVPSFVMKMDQLEEFEE